jgi:hypothetical protein
MSALARAAQRLQTAQHILAELRLVERWRLFGRPVIVGAVAYGLVVAPDIDLEVFCAEPRLDDGFAILHACAHHSRVLKARFANELDGPDQGLYWQLRYRHEDGVDWKIDMWSLPHHHPGPYAAAVVDLMTHALTDETRLAILELKEHALRDPALRCRSINIYRAVLDDGVRTVDQFRTWLAEKHTDDVIAWRPKAAM